MTFKFTSYFLLVFSIFLISCDSDICEEDVAKYKDLYDKGYEAYQNKDLVAAINHLEEAQKIIQTDSASAALIHLYAYTKRFDKAFEELNVYKTLSLDSEIIDLSRSLLFLAKGDTLDAVEILKEIINEPVSYSRTWITRELWDMHVYKNSQHTRTERLYRYYYDYYIKLYALSLLINMADSDEAYFEYANKIFLLSDEYENAEAIKETFQDILHNNFRYNILSKSILDKQKNKYVSQFSQLLAINTISPSDMASHLKWSLFNDAILKCHKKYGFQSAIDFIKTATDDFTRNTDTFENSDAFLTGIYLNAYKNGSFPSSITSADLDYIINQEKQSNKTQPFAPSFSMTAVKPLFTRDSTTHFPNKTKIVILLKFNSWEIGETAEDLETEIYKSIGKENRIVYIDQFYHIDSVSFSANVYINRVPSLHSGYCIKAQPIPQTLEHIYKYEYMLFKKHI